MNETNLKKLSPANSKKFAQNNIINKIKILETWLRDGIPWEHDQMNQVMRDADGHRVSVYFPISLRSFNTWTGESYTRETRNRFEDLTAIKRNGTDTLNKYPELKERASYLIKMLMRIITEQKALEAPSRIPLLELQIKRLNIFIENQAKKIIELQRENISLSREIVSNRQRDMANFEELRKNYFDIDNQNEKLKKDISEITKQLKNVHSIRNVKNET